MILVDIVSALIVLAGMGVLATCCVDPDPPALCDRDVLRAIRAGDRMRAIRWYRTLHGTGLAETKQIVAEIARSVGLPRAGEPP